MAAQSVLLVVMWIPSRSIGANAELCWIYTAFGGVMAHERKGRV